jgi:hypothetical protein
MSEYLFIVSGVSGSGKDTVYELLNEIVPCRNIKFSSPCKRMVEDWLDLPNESLNDNNFKSQHVINPVNNKRESFTYLDMLIEAYHCWDKMYPGGYLSVGKIKKTIEEDVWDLNLCFTDVRKDSEIELIQSIQHNYDKTILFTVNGDRGNKLSTDGNTNIYKIIFDDIFELRNNRTTLKRELKEDLQRYLEKV